MAHSLRTLCQSVLLTPKELAALQSFKRAANRSASTVIREALEDWINRSPIPVRWPNQAEEAAKVTITKNFTT